MAGSLLAAAYVVIRGQIGLLASDIAKARGVVERGVSAIGGRAASAFTRHFAGLGAGLFSTAINQAEGSLRSFVGEMISAGSDFEQFRISLDNLYGSAEAGGKAFDDFKKFALATPFDMKGIVAGARKLRVVGFEAEDVIPVLQRTGDIMSSVGGDTEQMERFIDVLTNMRTSGRVNAMQMRQLTAMGLPGWDALAKQIGKTVQETRALSKAGQISGETGIFALMKMADDPRFQGGINRVQASFKVMQSNLYDLFQQLAVQIGDPLFQALKDTFGSINNYLLSEAGQQWATSLRDRLADAVVWIQNAAASLYRIREAIGHVVVMALRFVGVLLAVRAALAVLSYAAGVLSAAFSLLATTVGILLSPLGLLGMGVVAGVAAWVTWSEGGQAALTYVRDLWGKVSDNMQESWDSIVAAVKAGDLELAFKIAAKTIEVEWVRLIGVIEARWKDFLNWFRSTSEFIDKAVIGFARPHGDPKQGPISRAILAAYNVQPPRRDTGLGTADEFTIPGAENFTRTNPLPRRAPGPLRQALIAMGLMADPKTVMDPGLELADEFRRNPPAASGVEIIRRAFSTVDVGGAADPFLGLMRDVGTAMGKIGDNPRAEQVAKLMKELSELRATPPRDPGKFKPEPPAGLGPAGMPKVKPEDVAAAKPAFLGLTALWKKIQEDAAGAKMLDLAKQTADNTAMTAKASDRTAVALDDLTRAVEKINVGLT